MQESFGDYRILERIGAGGTAEVFRARDTRRGRTAAIKVLTSDLAMDPAQGPRFVDEAFLATTLGHPNVAALYEVGEQDGRPHLVYEYVQGQTLGALLAGRPLNQRRAVDFAVQIADGLAEAHAIGLVHRGLRPDKIVVSLKGTAKTIDFGIGQYAMAVTSRRADSGTTVPAVAYWAPEQRAGAEGDHRVDIYALGLVLLEMLTGRPPSTDGQLPLTSGVGREIQPIVARMIDANPDRRGDSAATVAAELRALAAELDARREATPLPVVPSAQSRSGIVPRWVLVVLALVVAAALVWLAARS